MREGPRGYPLSMALTRAILDERSVPTHLAFLLAVGGTGLSKGYTGPAGQAGLDTKVGLPHSPGSVPR